MLYRFFSTIVRNIDRLNDLIGRTIAWLTLAMVIVTCAVVIVRYVFNLGSIALQESVMYMHGIVFLLGIAYTLKEKAHVRVDVLYERFPARVRTIVDLLGHLFLLLPVATFILVGSIDYVSFSWSLNEASAQPGGLPGVFIVKSLIPAMAFLLLLQGIAEVLRSVSSLAGWED